MMIHELELPFIDLTDQKFADNPYPQHREAIKKHWLAETPVGYMILTYEDMRDLLIQDEILQTSNQAVAQIMGADPETSIWAYWNNSHLTSKTGDDHKRIRMLLAKTFTPRNADRQRHMMQEVLSDLLDEWVPKGEFNFTEFASFYPITVLCRLIGADPALVPKMKGALEQIGAGFSLDPSILPKLDEAIRFLWDTVEEIVVDGEEKPNKSEAEQDLLDQLVSSTRVENGLSREELDNLVILLLGGGYDTSKNGLGLLTHLLLDRPDYWQRLVNKEKGFAKKLVDETLRMTNVVTTFRIAKEDFEWKGVTIPAGTMLIFPLPLAGQDESVYQNGTDFDPDRDQSREARPFGFGRGEHNCLGQHLARIQIEEGLSLIAERMPDLSRNGEVEWRPFPGVWGLKSLPVKTSDAA